MEVQKCYDTMMKVRNNLITLIDQSLACAKKVRTEYVKDSGCLVAHVNETIDEISCHKYLSDKKIQSKVIGEERNCVFNYLDIKRVLQNLLINAGYASPPDGPIRVTLTFLEDRTEVMVEDEGEGIPVDVKPILLKEPFTTKPDGNGFGLISCKDIIHEYHQGRLWFESELGTGTTFHFSLPRVPS